jgi:hypothetical protein
VVASLLALALVEVTVLTARTSSSRAAASAFAAPRPAALPPGYSMVRQAQALWIYPSSAEPEVDALRQGQHDAWTRITRELGVALPEDLDIRIALNTTDMQRLAPDGRRLPGYASGVAFPDQGVVMLSFSAPGSWLRPDMEQLLVHELSHVALHRALAGHEVPRWFSEGVAIHQAREHSLARARVLWEGSVRGDLIPLRDLSSRFPAGEAQVDLAYAQAADLVGHMLDGDNGSARFTALITAVRNGQTFEQAFAGTYGMSLDRLERQWRGQLATRFGRLPSILSGLTALWGLGALLLIAGYIRVRRKHQRTLKRWAIDEAPLLTAELVHPQPAQPPPAPPAAVRSTADEVLDSWSEQQHRDSGVPTVVHEGRSHTLH